LPRRSRDLIPPQGGKDCEAEFPTGSNPVTRTKREEIERFPLSFCYPTHRTSGLLPRRSRDLIPPQGGKFCEAEFPTGSNPGNLAKKRGSFFDSSLFSVIYFSKPAVFIITTLIWYSFSCGSTPQFPVQA